MDRIMMFLLFIIVPVSSIDTSGVSGSSPKVDKMFQSLMTSDHNKPILSSLDFDAEHLICCGKEPFKARIVTDLYPQCWREIGKKESNNAQDMICVSECVGKKLEVVDDNGSIKEDDFMDLCHNFVEGDEKLEEFVNEICSAQIKMVKYISKATRSKYKCNLDMIMAFHGVFIKTMINCPSNLRNKGKECENFRKSMKMNN